LPSAEGAQREGVTVRAVLLCNPCNPLGDVYSPEKMKELLAFCAENRLHCVVDEIYAHSVFAPSASFVSAISFADGALSVCLSVSFSISYRIEM
jgi:aspartate/methionine/tyrosine aminotransferase